jgi:hypothetical protein
VCCEEWRDLAINHAIEVAAPVELIRPFTEAEHWCIGSKRNEICAVRMAEDQLLNQFPSRIANGDSERFRLNCDTELADAKIFLSDKLSRAKRHLGSERDQHG